MSQDIDVQAELIKRLKAHFDSTLRSKLQFDARTQIAGVDISHVDYHLLSIDYDNLKSPVVSTKTLVTKEFRNPTDAVIHSTFNETQQTTDSFTYSFTEGLKLGASMKFSAGVPLVGKAGVTLTAELTLTAGQQKTVSSTNSWSESNTFDIPARHAIKASIVLNEAQVSTPFTATVLASGPVSYTLNNGQGFTGSLEGGVNWPTRPDLNKLPLLTSSAERTFAARGQFTGKIGIATHVDTEDIAPVGV